MAGGQQIDSAQGTVTQSAEVALVGEEVAVQDGTIVANTPADVAMTGAAATLSAGTAASAMLVSLRSRKVGGGSASRALTGSAIAASQGALALTASKTPAGSSITAAQGSFGKTRTRALTGSSATATPGTMGVSGQTSIFPLAVHPSGRYLTTAQGDGFLIHGDTPWSLPAQLTNAEIGTYIADRAARGFTAIMIEAIVRTFTSQTPDYRTVDGLDPFTPMTDFSSPNNAYWNRVDYIVNACKAQNMVVMLNPAYLGFNGGSEGWMVQVNAASAASLQAYGVFLANRYTQGNIIWCMGGDYAGTTTERNKQWNIVTGMRTVRTTDIITAHGAPGDQAYTAWNSYTGYNLNNAYPRSNTVYTYCATEYARSPAKPFFMIEGWYEGEPDPPTAAQRIRLQAYQSLLSGACGHFYGNNPVWHFESPNTLYPYTGTWESNLNSTGAQDMERVKDLFNAYQWELLEPKTDTSLVTSALGTGDSRICPARASDASFALIYIPSSSTVTVNMAALTVGSVRARLYNPTTGVYTTVTGSPFTPSGTQAIASGGECVLVLDEEPTALPWTGLVRSTDGSVADVQAKITAASTGDIIEIPAGSFAWSTGITNNKGILIRGAGGGRVLGYHNATNISIGTGTKTFTVNEVPTQTGAITVGMTLRCWVTGGERNSGGAGTGQKPWMQGIVTSYSGGTLTMNITSTSGHSMTKRLWIITTNATTTITNNTGSTGRLMNLTENATLPTGVTGIRFEGGTVSNNANHVHILPTTGGKPIHVYDNWIGIEGAMIAVETTGVNRGLIYNNSVVRFNWLNSVGECLKVTGPSNSWSTTSTMGTADTDGLQNVYFEDNDIHAMVTTVDIDDYGRACIRYNLCNESPMGGSHGADTSNFGVRHGEFNHNTFVFTQVGGSPDLETFDLNRWILLRGGTGTVYANVMPNITSTAWGNKDEIQLQIQNLDRNAGPNACWGANIGGSQYPCPRQIGMGYVTGSGTDGLGRSSDGFAYVGDSEPMYIWSNTGSPSIAVLTGYEGASECTNPDAASTYIQASRDYFTSAKPGYTEHVYPNELRVD